MVAAVSAKPGKGWDSIAAVDALRRGARLSEAMAACDDLLRRSPADPKLLLLAATIRRDRQQYSDALSFLDRLLAQTPDKASVYCDAARLRRQCGSTSGAIDAYRLALGRDPTHAVAHCELAELLIADSLTDDAIYHLEVAIAIDPGRLDARQQLSALMEAHGRGNDATALRRETMHRARRSVQETYTKIRTPAAAASPRALQRLRLSWAHALLVYGTAGIGVAKYEEREGNIDAAVAAYRETLAVLAEGADQARVVSGLRRVFATASLAFSQCHYELALLHERRGDAASAIYHLEEALKSHGSPWDDAYDRLGALVQGQGGSIAGIRDAVAGAAGQRTAPSYYPITRWNFARVAKDWFPHVTSARAEAGQHGGNRIAIPACSPYDFEICLAVACALVARGHSVEILWLPGLRFEGNGDAEPSFDGWDEVLMAHEVEALAAAGPPDGLKLIDLRGVGTIEADGAMEQEAERLAALDVGRRRATNTVYGTDRPAAIQSHNRVSRNLHALRRFARYFADNPPHHLLVMNGEKMEAGCAYWAARQAGCDAIVWDASLERGAAISIACNETRAECDFSDLWLSDDPHELTPPRRERVLSWLTSRTGGDFRLVSPRKQYAPPARSFAALAGHRLDSVRPVVVLYGDRSAVVEAAQDGDAFVDSKTWILRNIELFAQHPEWQLIVRLYPQDGPSGVRMALREKRADLPRNVSLVESGDAKLDYQLLEVAQLGLFRTNPIGLEIAMMGVVAVSAGRPYFCDKGFTRDTADEETYFRMVRRALENPESVAMTDREIELAWCFADLSIYGVPKPFPWSGRNFWRDVTDEWPIRRVLGGEGSGRFGRVFAALSGEFELPDGVVGDIP